MSNSVAVYFAGLTGPERSGGEMASSFTLIVNGKIQTTSAKYTPAHQDSSWHTSTYLALSYAVEQSEQYLRAPSADLTFLTDNKMVVQQMTGRWGAKDGHYLDARADALATLERVLPGRRIRFVWVSQKENRAVTICKNLFQSFGVKLWSWKEEKQKQQEAAPGGPRNPIVNLRDGSKTAWSDLKLLAKRLGPDIFPDSYRLSWMTAQEKEGGPDAYLDHRVRSNDPDDFLSRIAHLISGSDEPFVPKD
jgi:ribonuclease HI